ncbi:MAG: outer membrane lipoprotein carrier protein LolA [Myxococcales bacterium FL481]|nr:MAG: outer membrane lipoprotein carrier protein LolA [Myxococcales bacterium FL481]
MTFVHACRFSPRFGTKAQGNRVPHEDERRPLAPARPSKWRRCRWLGWTLAVTAGITPPALAQPPSTAPAPVAPNPTNAEELLRSLATMPGLEASFREEKHLRLLAAPLISHGKLYFAPPGYLARVVESPQPSTVVITPTSLRYDHAGEANHVDLRARPDVRSFVDSFVRVLAGDVHTLRQTYELSFAPQSGSSQAWRLELRPKAQPLAGLITRLEIRGSGLAVREIRVDEASGDWSITRIEQADPTRRFSAVERRELFGDATQ